MPWLNNKLLFVTCLSMVLPVMALDIPAMAEISLEDCYKSEIIYEDDPDVTQAERLEAMDAAFFDSISRFEECQRTISDNASSADGSGSGGGGSDAGSDSGSSEAGGSDAGKSQSSAKANPATTTGSGDAINASGGNGKLPEDIPPADNDDAIAAQIRLAAEVETDPEKKERLWNEYRKYKGMQVKPDE